MRDEAYEGPPHPTKALKRQNTPGGICNPQPRWYHGTTWRAWGKVAPRNASERQKDYTQVVPRIALMLRPRNLFAYACPLSLRVTGTSVATQS
jgi:hypothetical protein